MPASRRKSSAAVQTPLETYLREINETSLLSANDEHELAMAIGLGDMRARDRMVRANLRLVVNIARGYTGKGLGLQDLIEEGQPRPAPGRRRLRSRDGHAVLHLRQLLDQAVDQAGPDQHGQDDPHSGLHGRAALEMAAGQRPADRRTRPHADAGRNRPRARPGPQEAADHQEGDPHLQLTPQTDQAEAGWSLGEMIMDENLRSPEDEMVENDNLMHVMAMLKTMDAREATVLRMRFGLDDHEPRTLKEIGESLGLTRERVRQIETEALGKLADGLDETRRRITAVSTGPPRLGAPRLRFRACPALLALGVPPPLAAGTPLSAATTDTHADAAASFSFAAGVPPMPNACIADRRSSTRLHSGDSRLSRSRAFCFATSRRCWPLRRRSAKRSPNWPTTIAMPASMPSRPPRPADSFSPPRWRWNSAPASCRSASRANCRSTRTPFHYELEYGTDTLEMHIDGVSAGQNVLLVDDLLATGGTMQACCQLDRTSRRKGGRLRLRDRTTRPSRRGETRPASDVQPGTISVAKLLADGKVDRRACNARSSLHRDKLPLAT